MGCYKLTFDPTDTESQDASANVGAHIRAGTDGDLIGSETLNALEWLRTAGPIIDSSGNEVSVTGNALDVNVASLSFAYAEDSAHTTADDGAFVLGIRVDDLSAVPASVLAGTEGDYQAFVSGPNGGMSVEANQLDIDDLNATDDAIQAWTFDGTGNAIGSTSGALDVNVASDASTPDTEINSAAQNATTTTGAILGAQLAARKYFFYQNNGNKEIYVGESGVTTSTGLKVSPGMIMEFRLGPSLSMHHVAASGTQDTRVMEIA